MFEKSRRKIVAAIMSILALVFLGTLGIIYASSYGEVAATNREMLARYAELYSLEDLPGMDGIGDEPRPNDGIEPILDGPDDLDGPAFEDTPSFQLSTFYSVAIADTGETIAVDTGKEGLYEEATLKEYAAGILESDRVNGVKNNLLYLKEEKSGYTLVAFMDNTVIQESMTTLFRYTLVFGSIALLVLFFVAVQLQLLQNTIRGITADVIVIHRHVQHLMQDRVDTVDSGSLQSPIVCQVIVESLHIRFLQCGDPLFAEVWSDKGIVHILIVFEGVVF